jgi:photosystem II stability/assembly factor-like uncharacterized protein
MKRTSLVRLAGILGLLALPVLASAADCWLRDGAAPTATNVVMMCQQGRVYVSTDAGASWTPSETKANAPLRAISFSDAQHGVVVGDSGQIFSTENGGRTWMERLDAKNQRFTTEHLMAVFSLGNRVWAAGFDGIILVSANGGGTWERQDSGTTFGLENIFFSDQDHGWVVGWSGTILRTENGGKTWKNVSSKLATWSLSWVFFKDLKIGWAVGFNGLLLRTKDGGLSWESQKSPISEWLKSIAVDKGQRLWIANDDQLMVSSDGEKWQAVSVSKPIFMRRMLAVGDKMWAIGQLGIYQQSDTKPTEWKLIESLQTPGSSITTIYTKAGSN